jgi:hypothetical protein
MPVQTRQTLSLTIAALDEASMTGFTLMHNRFRRFLDPFAVLQKILGHMRTALVNEC